MLDQDDRIMVLRYDENGGFWATPGGKVEAGETPREAARREFREETGLDGGLLETPAAVTVRAYREGWTPTLGLSYAAVLNGSLAPAGESRQPAAWTPLASDWEGAFPGDRPQIRAFAGHLKASWRAATSLTGSARTGGLQKRVGERHLSNRSTS